MGYEGRVLNQRGEPICGMRVSDGRNITVTDGSGFYFLPGYERTRMIYVCALTARMDDWYIHTEGRKGPFDFHVEPAAVSSDFCFFHTSDTEIEGRKSNEWVRSARELVGKHRPAFFMHTGDLCRDDGVRRHCLVMNERTVGCPVRYAIGNHDYIGEKYGEEIYELLYGPLWYSFDCGEIHFAVLPIGQGDRPSGYEPEDALRWLQNDLRLASETEPQRSLIVFDHDCCEEENDFCLKGDGIRIDLKRHGLLAWIFGHYHINLLRKSGDVFSICTARPDSGGIDSSAAGIRKIALSGSSLSSRMLYHILPLPDRDPYIWRTGLKGQLLFSALAGYGEDVIACTSDDSWPGDCGIFRISGENGKILWKYPAKSGIKNRAAMEKDRIYAQDCSGWLYCVNAEDGSLRWKTLTPLRTPVHTRTGVLTAEGYVFAGSSSQVYACDAAKGEILWRAEYVGGEGSPAGYVYDEKDRLLIVSSQWNCLYALDITDGKTVWINRRPEGELWYRTSTPLIRDGVIYTVSLDRVLMLDAASGRLLGEKKIGYRLDVAGAPLLDEGELYYPTAECGVLALDAQNLEIVRRFPTGKAALFTSPYLYGDLQTVESDLQIIGDQLIFAASDGTLRIYDKRTAELLRKINVGAPVIATPVLGKGWAIVGDFEGKVTKYETALSQGCVNR